MAKQKRKRCVTEKCNKLSIGNGISNFCPECDKKKEELEDPFFGLKQLTEVEAERWARLDAEIRNMKQGQEIQRLKKDIANYQEIKRREQFSIEQQKKDLQIATLENKVQELRKIYTELVESFAKKYEIEKGKMVIDPDTRVIRELED